MLAYEKKSIISLPAKLALTSEGTNNFLQMGRRVSKYTMSDDTTDYGVVIDTFSPTTIQRLIMLDYISKIEIPSFEYGTSPEDMLDLSKLIVFSLQYRQFDTRVMARLSASDCVTRWNRHNPQNTISLDPRIHKLELDSFVQERQERIDEAKNEILKPLREMILSSPHMNEEEKKTCCLIIEKFISILRPTIWFILIKLCDHVLYSKFVHEIRGILSGLIEKTKIAEYLALIILEIAMQSELCCLKREARLMFKNSLEQYQIMQDEKLRSQVMRSLQKKGEVFHMLWRIGNKRTSTSEECRVEVTLFEGGKCERPGVANTGNEPSGVHVITNAKDLIRHLTTMDLDSKIGQFYMAKLFEACVKINTKLEAQITQPNENHGMQISFVLFI